MEVLLCENGNKNDVSPFQTHIQLFTVKFQVIVSTKCLIHTDQRKPLAQMTSQTLEEEIILILYNLFQRTAKKETPQHL